MDVTFLEFKQNKTCNTCFDKRADEFVSKHNIDISKFHFHGISIPHCDASKTLETRTKDSKK